MPECCHRFACCLEETLGPSPSVQFRTLVVLLVFLFSQLRLHYPSRYQIQIVMGVRVNPQNRILNLFERLACRHISVEQFIEQAKKFSHDEALQFKNVLRGLGGREIRRRRQISETLERLQFAVARPRRRKAIS